MLILVQPPNPLKPEGNLVKKIMGGVGVDKGLHILLSNSQAGPGRKVKEEQEEISRNHVPRLFLGSVVHNRSATKI